MLHLVITLVMSKQETGNWGTQRVGQLGEKDLKAPETRKAHLKTLSQSWERAEEKWHQTSKSYMYMDESKVHSPDF